MTACSVLLVEDNAADARLTTQGFTADGRSTEVTVVGDGVEAMEVLRDDSRPAPDLILLDLNLPRKSGLETLAEVKEDPALRSIPVVILTTSQSADEVARAYDLHANAVLAKPLRLSGYREMVEALTSFWLDWARLPGRTS